MAIVALVHVSTYSASYYVSPSGSDSNPGTEARPFLTLRNAMARLSGGDTLYVRGGVFPNDWDLGRIASGSSWSSMTTIRNYPGETPVIRPATSDDVSAFNLSSSQYICIEGLEIDLSNTTCTGGGVKFTENANHNRLTNCVIHHIYESHGVLLSTGDADNADNNEILGNTIHHAGWKHQSGSDDHGIYCKTRRNKIIGNHIYEGQFLGIQLYDGAPYENIVAYNLVHNQSIGIGVYQADTNWVYNNICYSNGQGIVVGYMARNTYIANNTCWRNGCNFKQQSNSGANTWFDSNIAAEGTSQVDGGGFRIEAPGQGVWLRNNLSYGNAKEDWNGGGTASDNRFGNTFNARFRNAPISFLLEENSDARDFGRAQTLFGNDYYRSLRPQGAAWDIGAVEFVTTATSNQAPTISDVDDQYLERGGTSGPLPFSVGDTETSPTNLSVTGQSSDSALLPASGIVLGGAGANRTVTLTPAADRWGTALVTLQVTDGANQASTIFTLTVRQPSPTNAAPIASAGPDQSILQSEQLNLSAAMSDDGLPSSPGRLTASWSLLQGPGQVSFSDPGSPQTSATFYTNGSYVLRLTVSDGALMATDELQVTVNAPPPNVGSSASAGPDQVVDLYDTALLSGSAIWQGSAVLPPTVTTRWTVVTGAGTVEFSDASVPQTSARFSATGEYLLRLTVTDGTLRVLDELTVAVTVTPREPGNPGIALEAESAILTSPMAAASGAPSKPELGFVSSPTAEEGTATFTVALTEGADYVIWCHVLAPTSGADSFHVSVDGGAEVPYVASEGTPSPDWRWTRVNQRVPGATFAVEPRVLTLAQGSHTVTFRSREANTMLDRIIVTHDADFDPDRPIQNPNTPDLPRIASIQLLEYGNVLTWSSAVGTTYQVSYKNDLADPSWTPLSEELTSAGPVTTWADTTLTGSSPRVPRFYAVTVLR